MDILELCKEINKSVVMIELLGKIQLSMLLHSEPNNDEKVVNNTVEEV